MFFKKKKRIKKDNKHFIIALAAVLFLCLVYFIFVLLNMNPADNMPAAGERAVKDEIKRIKKDNSRAVEIARNAAPGMVRPIDKYDHVRGNKAAPVQLIVYSDFECPFCAQFSETVKKVEREFPDKLAIAFRHFPLKFHANALTAAVASECAAEQGLFWEMHDRLFLDRGSNNLNIDQFKNDALSLRADAVKFNSCLDSLKYKSKVEAQMEEARSFGVSGTPGSFVNGEFLPGAAPFEDFIDSSGRQREGMKTIIKRHLESS